MGGGGKDVPHDSAEGFGWRHDDVHGSQRQSPPPRAHPPKLPSSSNKPTKAQNISNQTKPNATPLKLLQTVLHGSKKSWSWANEILNVWKLYKHVGF